MMRSRNTLTLLPFAALAFALVLAIAFQAGASRSAAAPKQITAAVVDLEEVFQQLHERSAADQRLQQIGQQMETENKTRLDELTRMQDDLEATQVPGTPKYREAEDELIRKTLEHQAWVEFKRREIEREKAIVMENLYRKIKTAVKEIAETYGYDLVLMDDSQKELQRGTEQQIIQQISLRRILYANPQIDITTDVINKMNNNFAANGG